MRKFSPRFLKEIIAVAAGLAYGIGLVILLFNVQGRITIESTDTFTYADTARQIAAGQGITTKIIQPWVAAPHMPQATWPPFFPILVAIPLALGLTLAQAVMTTPILTLAFLAAIFVWYVVRRWGLVPALFFAAFTLTAAPLLHVAAQPMTEAVFFGFSLLTAILTWEVWESSGKQRPMSRGTLVLAVLLGVSLTVLGAIRYLGFAFVPAVGLLFLVQRRWPVLLATGVGLAVTAGPFLFRNFVLFHSYSNKRFPTDAGFFLNLQDAFVGMGKDFMHYLLWPIIRLVVVAAVLGGAWLWVRRRTALRFDASQRFGMMLVWFALVYLGGMVVTRTFFFFDKLNTSRFVAPVEWLALAGVCLVSAGVIKKIRPLLWVTVAIVVLYGIRYTPHLYREPAHARLPESGRLMAWASTNTEPDSLILSNHAHSYNFFLGRSVLAIREYRAPVTEADLQDWAGRWRNVFSNVYIVLNKNLSGDRHTDLIVDLSNEKNIPALLEPIEGEPGIVVAYRLRK